MLQQWFSLRGNSLVRITPTTGCAGRLSSIFIYQHLLERAYLVVGWFGLPPSPKKGGTYRNSVKQQHPTHFSY
jgi:hypothetical protein